MANFLADDQEPAAPAGGMMSLFPPPPQHETHTTSESGSSTPVASPEYNTAIGQVASTANEQADTVEAKGQADVDVAKAMQEEAKQQLAALDATRAEKAAESARQSANIKAQADVLREANQQLKAQPAPALFHDGEGWKGVAKAVALAIGAFGDALAAKGAALGGRSSSQNSVAQTVNMLLDQDRAKIEKLKDNQLIAKTGLKDAVDARATAMAEVDARGAEAMRRAQMLGEYMVKSAGPQAAVYQARLDALGLQQHANEFRAQSLAALHKTITGKHATENIDRDPAAVKPPAAGGIPTEFVSGGEKFAVNPAETTRQLHGQSRNQLALIQGAIKNTEEVLASLPDNEAPQSTVHAWFTGDKARSDANAKLALIRNQMAAALKESMGEAAAKERANSIVPDVPQTDHSMPAFKAKLHAGVVSMHDQLGEVLHAAGGHAVGKAAPEPALPSQAQGPAKPSAPAAPVRTATNPQTGEKLKFDGGKWVPL